MVLDVDSRWLDLDGYKFQCAERGWGPPILFVHGSVSDARCWAAQMEEFSARHRAIAYSRRYHWPNAEIPPKTDYSMLAHTDDLEKLIETLVAAPVHIVGHSYGAFIALILAIRRPDLVRSLVLAEPPAITLFVNDPPNPLQILALLLTRPRTAAAIINFGAKGIAPAKKALKKGRIDECIGVFGVATLGQEAFEKLSSDRLQMVRDNFIPAEFAGSGFPPLRDRDIRRIKAPALVLTGQNSPRLFHHIADRLAALLPKARRAHIPNASHIMHEDNPDAFNGAVANFLARL